MAWRLKRTAQCASCPWIVGNDPHAIPNGYSVDKHQALADTIADPEDPIGHALAVLSARQPLRIFACHSEQGAHCVGWMANQLGAGNNVALRMAVRDCENIGRLRLRGPQHQRFEDTLPPEAATKGPHARD
jgi:hypothetical protein